MGHLGLIPGLGSSPRGRHGNPLWYCCLENSMDRGAWQATVHGIPNCWTQLSDFHFSLLWKKKTEHWKCSIIYGGLERDCARSEGLWSWKLHALHNISAAVEGHGQSAHAVLKIFFSMFLLIYLAALALSCGTQDLPSSLWHTGSSSETRDRTWVPR